MSESYDAAILGGGLVGTAVGLGLAGQGLKTAILDEGDVAHRASRGNFALVWVQSKGMGMPRYSSWTRESVRLWPSYAAALGEESGIEVSLQQPGGFTLALGEPELERRAQHGRLLAQPGFEHLDYEVGAAPSSAKSSRDRARGGGAIYCPLDGHVNSLRLFRAQHVVFARRGGAYLPNFPAEEVTPLPGAASASSPAAAASRRSG
jgi:glycine/D-amino acid oxidase-like deaminating enzyme